MQPGSHYSRRDFRASLFNSNAPTQQVHHPVFSKSAKASVIFMRKRVKKELKIES
jgi:hypothetical protein